MIRSRPLGQDLKVRVAMANVVIRLTLPNQGIKHSGLHLQVNAVRTICKVETLCCPDQYCCSFQFMAEHQALRA